MSQKPAKLQWFKDFVEQGIYRVEESDKSLICIVAEKMKASGVESPTQQSFQRFLGLVCLERYVKLTNQSLLRATSEFPLIKIGCSGDMLIQLLYWREFKTLCSKLEYLSGGEYICQEKPNQRKYLVLRYSADKESLTSDELSKALGISLQNASFLLKWYCRQGLFTREKVREKRRGRPTFIYKLTHVGEERVLYLARTMSLLPRKATNESETYRSLKDLSDLRMANLIKKVGTTKRVEHKQ